MQGKTKAECKLQAFCELIQKPIRERIKTRYNASIKTKNDVFVEKVFTMQWSKKCMRSKALTKGYISLKNREMIWSVEMMGLIGAGNNPMVGMTSAVAVAI